MRYKIRQSSNVELVKELHTACFPDDEWEAGIAYWIVDVAEDTGRRPIGFASIRKHHKWRKWVTLNRVGILSGHRGRGLQLRLIRAREKWAKKKGYKGVSTFVANHNTASLINVLRCNYTLYDPISTKGRKFRRDGYQYFFKKFPV